MHSYPVEVEAHPTFQDGAFLEDQLYAYNVEQTGYDDGTYLTLWVKSPTGERLAGLHGWTCSRLLHRERVVIAIRLLA